MTRATTKNPRAPTAPDARVFAVISGVTGAIANVLLLLFFALAEPFSGRPTGQSWLGPANDWLVLVQFAALAPVATALSRCLPMTSGVRVSTAAGVVAMAATALLQLLLVIGVLPFQVQVWPVIAALLVVYMWVLTVSIVGHRTGSLPRSVSRSGLLLGPSLPIGLLVTAAGLAAPEPVRSVLLVPGLVIGGTGWLALPFFSLSLARRIR